MGIWVIHPGRVRQDPLDSLLFVTRKACIAIQIRSADVSRSEYTASQTHDCQCAVQL